MQVLPIILVAVVMAADAGVSPLGRHWQIADAWVWLDMWLAPLAIVWAAWLIVRSCATRLRRDGRARSIIKAERAVRIARVLVIINHVLAILVLDALGAVRRITGDLVLVDELITILPAMLALLMTWWVFYPVERLLLESALMRRLDEGSPVYPPLSRWKYVSVQARMQVLLTLIPVLVIAGLAETIDVVWSEPDAGVSDAGFRFTDALTLVAAAFVFLISPFIARIVLDTQPIPPGSLRDMLLEVCRRHRVGVRELLLWNTNGSTINAAVMGLIAPFRFVLITDALIETLREDEVRAVMAHEVGHVRRKHMAWLIVCLLACFLAAAHLIEWPLRWMLLAWSVPPSWAEPMTLTSAALQLVLGLTAFGWICRRFERQADTFAVQHLSGLGVAGETNARVTVESVDAMRSALETIAQLNTVDPARHSWRHGSIRWRQNYLDSIIGRPVRSLPIDRLIVAVKAASLIVMVAGIGFEIAVRELAAAHESDREAAAQVRSTAGPRYALPPSEPES